MTLDMNKVEKIWDIRGLIVNEEHPRWLRIGHNIIYGGKS